MLDTAHAAAGCIVLLLIIFYFGATVLARELRAEDLRYGMIGIVEARGPDVVPRRGPLLVVTARGARFNGLEIDDADELRELLALRRDEPARRDDERLRYELLDRERRRARLALGGEDAKWLAHAPLGDPERELLLAAEGKLSAAELRPYLEVARGAGLTTLYLVFHDVPQNPFVGWRDYSGARVELVDRGRAIRSSRSGVLDARTELRAMRVPLSAQRTFWDLARAAIELRKRGVEVRLDL
jgi:hypothetical protein